MRFLVQRCLEACVTVRPDHDAPYVSGRIGKGFVVFAGFGMKDKDTLPASRIWEGMLDKLLHLRVFPDEADKMNRSLLDCGGSLLVVSQFTLYADTRHGRRPAFTDAAPPSVALTLYEQLLDSLVTRLGKERVAHGEFGASMEVSLVNWGPVTIWLDSETLFPNG